MPCGSTTYRLGTCWWHAHSATTHDLMKSAEQIVRLVMAVNRHGIPQQHLHKHNTTKDKTPVPNTQAMFTDTLIP